MFFVTSGAQVLRNHESARSIDWFEAQYRHLDMATDTTIELQELEWKASCLSDEALAPEFRTCSGNSSSDRSLTEAFTDPKALFEMVRYD